MELSFINYIHNEKKLTFKIQEGKIIGLTGIEPQGIAKLITLENLSSGQIISKSTKITKENINEFRKNIVYVTDDIKTSQSNTYNIIIEYIKRNNLELKEPTKKIISSLKIVGLRQEILGRDFYTLSTSEKKLLQLAISLLSNPEIIIIDEPFKVFDKSKEKQLIMLYQRLRDQLKKTIIFVSDDENMLYKYTDEMFFEKNGEIIISGKTEEVYLNVDSLNKNKFSIPEIIRFTYMAQKNKKVKIIYHKDIRDIIKDIYKHI